MFALSFKVVELLLADEEWSRRLESAKTMEEVVKVLVEFCRAKGLKLKIMK